MQRRKYNPVRGWRNRWWQGKRPKDRYKICYRTKTDALKIFKDHNQDMIDELALGHGAGKETFDNFRHYYSNPKIDTLNKALWVAMPAKAGPPWCIEDIDVQMLNGIGPIAYGESGMEFTLPDHVEEARLAEQAGFIPEDYDDGETDVPF